MCSNYIVNKRLQHAQVALCSLLNTNSEDLISLYLYISNLAKAIPLMDFNDEDDFER